VRSVGPAVWIFGRSKQLNTAGHRFEEEQYYPVASFSRRTLSCRQRPDPFPTPRGLPSGCASAMSLPHRLDRTDRDRPRNGCRGDRLRAVAQSGMSKRHVGFGHAACEVYEVPTEPIVADNGFTPKAARLP